MHFPLLHALIAFGIPSGPDLFFIGVIGMILPIWASVRVIRLQTGASVPLWLLVIWIFPIMGSIISFFAVRDIREA